MIEIARFAQELARCRATGRGDLSEQNNAMAVSSDG
jgi:hypothetical protein